MFQKVFISPKHFFCFIISVQNFKQVFRNTLQLSQIMRRSMRRFINGYIFSNDISLVNVNGSFISIRSNKKKKKKKTGLAIKVTINSIYYQSPTFNVKR